MIMPHSELAPVVFQTRSTPPAPIRSGASGAVAHRSILAPVRYFPITFISRTGALAQNCQTKHPAAVVLS